LSIEIALKLTEKAKSSQDDDAKLQGFRHLKFRSQPVARSGKKLFNPACKMAGFFFSRFQMSLTIGAKVHEQSNKNKRL
jgi:hypothetical protein